MASVIPKSPPLQATCAVCLGRKQCVKKFRKGPRKGEDEDQFFYSPNHRGWLCRACWRSWQHHLERNGEVDYARSV